MTMGVSHNIRSEYYNPIAYVHLNWVSKALTNESQLRFWYIIDGRMLVQPWRLLYNVTISAGTRNSGGEKTSK